MDKIEAQKFLQIVKEDIDTGITYSIDPTIYNYIMKTVDSSLRIQNSVSVEKFYGDFLNELQSEGSWEDQEEGK